MWTSSRPPVAYVQDIPLSARAGVLTCNASVCERIHSGGEASMYAIAYMSPNAKSDGKFDGFYDNPRLGSV